MTVYSKVSYYEQDDRRVLKAAKKQQYIMFPVPIPFMNDELKAQLGMKNKKEQDEDEVQCCSLDKDSKT
jgi:hypothetical protein